MAQVFSNLLLTIYFRLCFFAIIFCVNSVISQPVFASTELSHKEILYIQQHPLIKVHAEQAWRPFNFIENNKASGYSNDLIRLVAEKVGLEVEFITGYQWDEYLVQLENKQIDVISNMKITPERQQYAIFTRYHSITAIDGLLTREGESFASDFSDIESMAVVKGFFYQELIERHYPHIRLTLTANTDDSIAELLAGNVDAVIDAYDVINFYLHRSLNDGVNNAPLHDHQIFNYLPQFMGVHKDNPTLRNILDKGLLAVNKRELDNLHKKWSLLKPIGLSKNNSSFQDKMPILTKSERQYLTQHGPITMCVDPDWLPIEAIEKGKYIGIGADFVALFGKRLSNPIVLLETQSWLETLNAIKEGNCDFIPIISKTPKRQETMSFTAPYLDFPLVLATHQDNQVYKLQQVLHKPLGIVKGYSYKEVFDNLYPEGNLQEYNSIAEGLDAVNRGEIYGFIDSLPVMAKQIQALYPEIKVVDKFEHKYLLSLAVAKNDPILLAIFSKVVASISLQQQQQILNRWLPVIYEKNKSVSGYWIAIALVSVLVLCLLLRLYCSKKYNQELKEMKLKLEAIAMRDCLTGLPNQYYFKEQLKKEWVRGRRSKEKISLLLVDIDNFKTFNQLYGRLSGDTCLVELSRRLQSIVKRPADLLARFHGEEFSIILPDTDEEGLKAIAAEIFYMLNAWGLKFKEAPTGEILSISIGASCMTSSGLFPEKELYRRAEQALYQAQDKGFNQMVIYQTGK